jgi:hypothetical protein
MNRSITRNEAMYPDAERFNPERWLAPSFPTYREPLSLHPNLNGGYHQFGFGRRTCQGISIVEQDLFLSMGGMAWAFDIRKKPGVEVHWNEFTPLLIAKPAPFEFELHVRGEEVKKVLRTMWEGSRDEVDVEAERRAEMERLVEGRKSGVVDDEVGSVAGSETSGPSNGASSEDEDSEGLRVPGDAAADLAIWA